MTWVLLCLVWSCWCIICIGKGLLNALTRLSLSRDLNVHTPSTLLYRCTHPHCSRPHWCSLLVYLSARSGSITPRSQPAHALLLLPGYVPRPSRAPRSCPAQVAVQRGFWFRRPAGAGVPYHCGGRDVYAAPAEQVGRRQGVREWAGKGDAFTAWGVMHHAASATPLSAENSVAWPLLCSCQTLAWVATVQYIGRHPSASHENRHVLLGVLGCCRHGFGFIAVSLGYFDTLMSVSAARWVQGGTLMSVAC